MNKIEAYLTQAQKRLRRALPVTHVESIISEARTHLTARTAELIEAGMMEEKAEATAIAAFGQPDDWARTIIQSAYRDDHTGKARIIAAGAAVLALLNYLTNFSYRIGIQALDGYIIVFIVAALGLAGGSFQARQAQSKLLLTMEALTALTVFLVYGFTQVYISTSYAGVPRADINGYINHWTLENKDSQQEINLLRLGLQAYQSPVDSKPIPAALRTPQGYIVPISISEARPPAYPWSSAFKETSPTIIAFPGTYTEEKALAFKSQMPYRTVATVAKAAQVWQNNAPIWLISHQIMLKINRSQLQAAQRFDAQPPAFDARAGLFYAIPVVVLTGFILLLSGIAAAVGRQVFRLQKHKRSLLT